MPSCDLLKRSGAPGWAICLGTVVVWDALAIHGRKIETLSEAAWRLWKHPLGRTALVAATSALFSHIVLEPVWNQAQEVARADHPSPDPR